ncbi:uncharacterized protein LOC115265607 isoform X2 [Aedes albopictus]|uniref:Uncharacterized protein n=1 Tax=Aedes albopictus TaxID=7160 RepID=A0ABM1YKK1_AEDAL
MKSSKKPAKFIRQRTASKTSLQNLSKETVKAPSRMLKPSTADDSSSPAVDPPVVFDLNGRKIRTNPEPALKDAHEEVAVDRTETEMITPPCTDLVSKPSELIVSEFLKQHALQNIKDQENEFLKIFQKYNRQPSESLLAKAIGERSTSKKNVLIQSESHPVFECCYEGEENVPSSTSCCEGACLKRVASRCCLANQYEGECSVGFGGAPQPRGNKFPWLAFWNGLSVLMIALLLGITLLVNFDHLMAIRNGREWRREMILPPPVAPEARGVFDRIRDFLMKLWVELKDMIVLDELEGDF